MDPEAQIVGADAWRRLRLYWLVGAHKCALEVLRARDLPVPEAVMVLNGLCSLADRAAGWSDLRRELYLGVLRRRVEAP